MDSVRYYLALALIMAMPGTLLFWLSIHPYISYWRKVGSRLTYTLHVALMVIVAVAVFFVRKPLLSAQFGFDSVLTTVSVPIFLLGLVMGMQRRKQMGTKVMVGCPELSPTRNDNRLLTEGIYSRMRNPRYVGLLLFLLAYALFSNYLAVYATFLVSLAGFRVIVWLEEKELSERFGEKYRTYCERVPRFIPRS